jgi:DNA-binding transcriptional LysR family regulator
MDKIEAMQAFARVVTLGSYAEAARSLGLTRSAVSKAVMELERILGARLLDRTTRKVSPTEAGRAYYDRCADILASIEEAELQVSRLHEEPRGVLRINAPMSFGALYLGNAIADFMSAYPEVRVELTLNDRFVDPIEEGVDVTVRIAALGDSSLIARRLAPAWRVLAASPRYLERHGEPRTPQDLASHRCLTYGHTTTLQRWRLTHQGEALTIPVASYLASNNGDALRVAAVGRPRHHAASHLHRRARHPGRQAARGHAGLSADASRHLRPLCAEPLSRRQDARADRFPGRALRRGAGLGPLRWAQARLRPCGLAGHADEPHVGPGIALQYGPIRGDDRLGAAVRLELEPALGIGNKRRRHGPNPFREPLLSPVRQAGLGAIRGEKEHRAYPRQILDHQLCVVPLRKANPT